VELQATYGQFKAKGAELAAVSMDDVTGAAQMAGLAQAQYFILADPYGAVARSYGVYNLLGDKVATPAVFIISARGNVLWRYIGQNAGDRPSPQEILEALDSLRDK